MNDFKRTTVIFNAVLLCCCLASTPVVAQSDEEPIASAQSVTNYENTPIAIDLIGSYVEGTALFYSIVSGPTNGTLSGTAPNLVYTPNINFTGSDSFQFSASDGQLSATAVVSITILPVNDAPNANAQSVTVAEDSTAAITLTASDVDGDALSYAIVSGPTNGTLSGTAPNLTYTPNANFNGTDSFVFRASDGTADSTAVIGITVTPVNDAPVASAQSINVDEDLSVGVTLTASDVDGDALTFTIVTGPAHGSLTGVGANFIYTPAPNFNGTDSFTFTANDGLIDGNVATISINVNPVNDAPMAANLVVTTPENTAVSIAPAGSDLDGDAITFIIASPPQHGSIVFDGTNLVYTPSANYNGSDVFFYAATDGQSTGTVASVIITVQPINDAPLANAQTATVAENNSVNITLTGSDVDGDTLSFEIISGPVHGALSGAGANLTYTPVANYNGPDSFTFRASDGVMNSAPATVSIAVTSVNNTPAASHQSVILNEDSSIAITLNGSDADGDALTFAIVSAPAHGTLSGAAPNLIYTPAANYNGPDSFTFTVNDGTTDSSAAMVSISMTAVNDAPVATPLAVAVMASTKIVLSGTDADGDALSYAIVSGPTNGTLSGTAPNLVYTPAGNYHGPDSFVFSVGDGSEANTAIVSITVSSTNEFHVTLEWDPNPEPEVVGYNVHVGTRSGTYTRVIDTGSQVFARVSPLDPGITYYLVVTARASDGLKSPFSDEISYTVPIDGIRAALTPMTITATTAQSPVTLQFTTEPGLQYLVQASFDLLTWQTVEAIAPDTDGVMIWTDVAAPSYAHRFYRVITQLP